MFFVEIVCFYAVMWMAFAYCFCKRRQNALRKTVFYNVKGHLLQHERWPFAKCLCVNVLRAGVLVVNVSGQIVFYVSRYFVAKSHERLSRKP